MVGGIVWGICSDLPSSEWVKAGLCAAKLSVESQLTVSPLVTPETVRAMMEQIEE
jgi:hypothetical protein